MDLEATVEELAPRLLRFCRGRLGDAPAAWDVAQDALTALVSRWRKSGPPESPEAYVFRIASRRASRAAFFRWRWLSLDGSTPSLAGQTPESLESRAALSELFRDLRRLSKKEREALLLIVGAELSVASAAAVLGVSESAVKMRVSRAREHLRRLGHGQGSHR